MQQTTRVSTTVFTEYSLCWGEAGYVRFISECVCFMFNYADDYYWSPECHNAVEPVQEGLYLETMYRPLT